MSFLLSPVAHASGYRLIAYDTIGSTSAEAMRLARDGDPGRLWIVSGEQTEGHGRRGRPWQTPRGNIAASLFIRVPGEGSQSATLGFAAGLALYQAICATVPACAGLELKWPNDVLINGAKVAGILLEAVSRSDGSSGVVVGIGVNVRHAPRGLPYPATSLAESGAEVTAEALFTALAEAWVEQEALWGRGLGFAPLRERWLAHAAGLGGPIAVQLGADVVRGTFETIDDSGRLVVRATDGGIHSVSAGEVYFGAAASAGL